MKKFNLLLLDANVVIEISRHGLWEEMVARCNIHLAQTVLDESQFYEDDRGDKHYIDLSSFVAAKALTLFDLAASQLDGLRAQFDAVYFEKLDPGETESLAYLLEQSDECRICSGDKIVYRVLGSLNRADQGVSLEEVLGRIGLGRKLAREFTKVYREEWTKKGFQERLTGIGLRPPKNDKA
ncbi:MAG: hypothetical protein ACYC6Y_12290 [Thermoguttaceae bacterium]